MTDLEQRIIAYGRTRNALRCEEADLPFLLRRFGEEAGELMEAVARAMLSRDWAPAFKVGAEIADVMILLTELAARFDFSAQALVDAKVDELEMRIKAEQEARKT